MRCAKDALLQAYVDGEVSPSDRAALDGHFVACEPCRERASLLEARARRLRNRLAALDPDEVRELSVAAMLELRRRSPGRPALAAWWRPLSLAATLAVAVVAGALLLRSARAPVEVAVSGPVAALDPVALRSQAMPADPGTNDPNKAWNDRELVMELKRQDTGTREVIVTSRDANAEHWLTFPD